MAYIEGENYVPVREVVSPESSVQRKSRQIVLGVLYGITANSRSGDPIYRSVGNGVFLSLARAVDDLVADERLIVGGRDQESLFQTGIMDTGCFDRGALFVGPQVEVELNRRPLSLGGEVVYELASAALVDGNIPDLGGLRSMREVRGIVRSYLRALPQGEPLTKMQIVLKEGNG